MSPVSTAVGTETHRGPGFGVDGATVASPLEPGDSKVEECQCEQVLW